MPEFYNEQVCADILGPAVLAQLERDDCSALEASFKQIHLQLRQNASEQAAQAIVELLNSSPATPT